MFTAQSVFSGFSVDNLAKAKEFYSQTLGLSVEEKEGMGLTMSLTGGGNAFVYQKDNHEAASFTILNFKVDDISQAVDELSQKGVTFEMYEDMHQDEKGIMRGGSEYKSPSIAWFKDPAGNILSVMQD